MIGVLIFPDFQILDAAGPISVFEIAGRFAKSPTPIRLIAADPGPVRATSGVEMLARKFGSPGAITTLIIAGGDGVEAAARNSCTLSFVRAVASRGTRVASICSGTFILAEAGASAPAPSSWRKRACSMAAAPPRTGCARDSSSPLIRP
jgi:transcriptional regulator GlxA family with amidase domain